jgi:hypothetical protein
LKLLGWALIVLLGALILCPAIAFFGFDPLPGDFHVNYGSIHYYIPLGTSLIASGALALLFLIMRR